jgi:hypothetical protein
MRSVDEAADHCDFAEGRLEQHRAFNPGDELLLQDIGREERLRICDRLQAIAGEAVIIGDEAERLETRSLHAPRDKHAERLVRVPAFEAVGDHIMMAFVREGLDEQLMRFGKD